MRRATIKSISEETGLSLATVSRALKASPAVRADTAKLVQTAAEKLGYRRSAIAANLRSGRTGLLSLLVPIIRPGDLLGDFGALMLLAGACSRLEGSDSTLTLTPFGYEDASSATVEALVARGVSDGLILTLTQPEDERVRWLQAEGIPFVTFGRTELPIEHPFFDFDDEDFAFQATRCLIARNCRRPAFVLQPSPALYNRHRRAGFERALSASGIPGGAGRIILQNSASIVPQLFEGERPDGIVCDNEVSAVATVAALEGAGLIVGRDIQLTTLSASALPGLLSPRIPSFFQDLHKAGWACADFLLRRLAGEEIGTLQHIERMTFKDAQTGVQHAAAC